MASISAPDRTGEPPTVRSQRASEGWAMTSTSAAAKASAESGPALNAATSKSRSASAAAARAYDEPEGCSG